MTDVYFSNSIHKLTINKELLFMGQDAGEVTALQATLSLRCFPCPPVCEVLIAVALKLVPAKVTNLRIWKIETREAYKWENTG